MGTIPKWKKCPKCSKVIDRDADFCLCHGGQIPRVKAAAEVAIENARRRLQDQAEAALRVNSVT